MKLELCYGSPLDRLLIRRNGWRWAERHWGTVERSLREVLDTTGRGDLKITARMSSDGAALIRVFTSEPFECGDDDRRALNERIEAASGSRLGKGE